MTRNIIAGVLALVAALCMGLSHANPLLQGANQFCLYDPSSGLPIQRCDEQVSGSLDPVPSAGPGNTLNTPEGLLSSPLNWSDIVTYAPGNYTVHSEGGGVYNFTVNQDQIGASMRMAWGPINDSTSCRQAVCDIEVILVWDVDFDGNTILVSSDWDGDGVPGGAMIDPPFIGLSPSFDLVVVGDIRPGPGVSVSIDVVGGDTQECTQTGGSTVTISADVTLFGGAELESIYWTVDGEAAGSGGSITPFLTLGSHSIEVLATTTTGESNTNSVFVTVQDTTPPTVNAYFLDGGTGEPISSVGGNRAQFVTASFAATDACDAEPQVRGVVTPTFGVDDGDAIRIQGNRQTVDLPTTALQLSVRATDASGNIRNGQAILFISD